MWVHGLRSGVRAGYTQYHQISEVTEVLRGFTQCGVDMTGETWRYLKCSVDKPIMS